jgi:ABC-type multidrug transport system fused ATPase/permease subunit
MPVLLEIDVEILPGEVVAIVGPSGAGKSTLLQLIPRFYDPDHGRVTIDGVDVRSATVASLREQVTLVSQEVELFATTVRENIRYGRLEATDAEVERAAEAASAHEFISGLPKSYDTLIGERGVQLSGGERQRVALARAILRDAPVLLLDEATASLDAITESRVKEALSRSTRRKTLIIVAHRLATVRDADRILVMSEGRIAGRLEPPEFSEERILRLAVLGAHVEDGSAAA